MARGLVKKLLLCGPKSFSTADDNNLEHGHIWVRVGVEEPQRFRLDAHFLSHPLFGDLLQLSVEEFGYSYGGALRIACETELFLHLLRLLRSSSASVHYMKLQNLRESFYARKLSSWSTIENRCS
ncbi:uncharacterized protein A4U43_C01F33630 [Asparagus officinalis]|uniref:Uncharacterized protein n=1 Tax=Asparagus officinalis TaxID=4686 RepID=A0A5P1FUT7_ASPOF|nr:auxin-responsive protein SAUR71-like [Asparagus officinalis]ONK81862.1 uncharacterized protein A4U43_C01F33630 [Asparagus officinalis]